MSRSGTIQYWREARSGVSLRRRGIDHGSYAVARRAELPAVEAWQAARPILLRGLLAELASTHAAAVRRSQSMFDRLARGADPSEELWRRLSTRSSFVSAGSSIDGGDPREIEKVHADHRPRGGDCVENLYAKFSWIRPELADGSLRIRFSFGDERAGDWQRDPARREASNRFCEAVFPESGAIARHRGLRALLRACAGGELDMAERIVYANAPNGGARFHHDAEPGQRGVLYAQLAGRTAWLALAKRELARVLCEEFPSHRGLHDVRSALRRLDADDASTDRLLNSNRGLTRALAARGALYVLRRGDVLLLPSHGHDDCAWHSVFALGRRPSLAHSYGLFD